MGHCRAAPTTYISADVPRRMGIIALILAIPATAAAQVTIVPAPPCYAMEPTMPLTPNARSPVQQQILIAPQSAAAPSAPNLNVAPLPPFDAAPLPAPGTAPQ